MRKCGKLCPYIYYMSRASNYEIEKIPKNRLFRDFTHSYLQPLHVLQFPEHFFDCFPVAENISPE